MEHRIQVVSIKSSLKDKTIILTCSADIDEDTVTPDNVCLALPSLGQVVPISLRCDRRKIIISIIPDIRVNDKYRLSTSKGIESVVGEPLEILKAMLVVFESAVVTDVKITAPTAFETVAEGEITFAWTEVGAEKDLCNEYEMQVATDSGFFNIVLQKSIVETFSFTTTLEPAQYFVRMRAVKGSDTGKWSKAVTFTVPKEKPLPVPNPQPEPKTRPGIPEIVDYTKDDKPIVYGQEEEEPPTDAIIINLLSDTVAKYDDEAPEAFEFVFDGAVNIDQATVVIKRRDS